MRGFTVLYLKNINTTLTFRAKALRWSSRLKRRNSACIFQEVVSLSIHRCIVIVPTHTRNVRYEKFPVSVYRKNYTDIIGIPVFL
jgi:hypothetical protein